MDETPAVAGPADLRRELIERVCSHLPLPQQAQAAERVEAMIAIASHTLGDSGSSAVLLTALALDRRVADDKALWDSGGALTSSLERQIPCLRVLEVMAEREELARDIGLFRERAASAARFLAAIAPRSPASLVQKPKQLSERVRWFLSVAGEPDSDVVARAKLQLQNEHGYGEPEARSLVWRLGVERLRTLNPELLGTIATNDRQWQPLVEVLAGERTTTPECDAELKRLLDLLQCSVGKAWQSRSPDRIEDAVQDALTFAIKSLRDPTSGYSYEGSLLAWLTTAVLNRLRRDWHRPQAEPLPVALETEPESTDHLDVSRRLEEWRARYLLVETFFKSGTVERVKALFEWMLLQAEEDSDEANDDRLAEYIKMRIGENVNKNTLVGTRRRLRQRLEVLRYMRDLVPGGAKDSPGDVALLAHITGKFGLAEPDVPTIRGLAALARACPPPRSLHWARLARLATRGDVSATAGARQEAEKHTPLSESALHRLAQALERPQQLHDLREWAKARQVGFLMAPCWCLAVLDGRTGDEAVRCLKPSNAEANAIRQMMSELLKEIS